MRGFLLLKLFTGKFFSRYDDVICAHESPSASLTAVRQAQGDNKTND